MLKVLAALTVLGILISCQKETIIDTQLVVTKIDRSIDTEADIMVFDALNENQIYAAGARSDGRVEIYKTTDGGVNWTLMTSPINFSNDLRIQAITFTDALNGFMVIDRKLYRTFDGANTWAQIPEIIIAGEANYVTFFFGAIKTTNNTFLLFEDNGNSFIDNRIIEVSADGNDFTKVHSFDHDGERYTYGSYSNGKYYYLTRDFNYFDQRVYVMDLTSFERDTLNIPSFQELVRCAAYSNGRHVLASKGGKIRMWGLSGPDNNYNYHSNDYNGIIDMGGYAVAVAENSVSTNINGAWEEAIDRSITTHQEYFQFMQKCSADAFFLSGNDGVFLKASVK